MAPSKHNRSNSISHDEIAALETHAMFLLGLPPYEDAKNGDEPVGYSEDPVLSEAEEHLVKCYRRGDRYDVNKIAPLLGVAKTDLAGLTAIGSAVETYYANLEATASTYAIAA